MGYTHYWRLNRDLTAAETVAVSKGARKILRAVRADGIELQFAYGDKSKGFVQPDGVFFNGTGDYSHEDFVFLFQGHEAFCKTARKPYDAAVVAILAMIKRLVPDAIDLSSDGTDNDATGKVTYSPFDKPDYV